MSTRVHFFQHVHFEGLAGIEPWLLENRFLLSGTLFHEGGVIPPVDAFDWLIVMGGPMNALDEGRHPWLVAEKRCIEHAIREGKAILGICLGAQILADVLGARVYPDAHREIGWHPIRLTDEARHQQWFGAAEHSTPFHWHGDTFDLPRGAVHLASSDACRNQAFAYGDRVLGLQFHIDSTPDSIELMIRHSAEDLEPGPFVQSVPEIRSGPPGAIVALSRMKGAVLGHFRSNIEATGGSR